MSWFGELKTSEKVVAVVVILFCLSCVVFTAVVFAKLWGGA